MRCHMRMLPLPAPRPRPPRPRDTLGQIQRRDGQMIKPQHQRTPSLVCAFNACASDRNRASATSPNSPRPSSVSCNSSSRVAGCHTSRRRRGSPTEHRAKPHRLAQHLGVLQLLLAQQLEQRVPSASPSGCSLTQRCNNIAPETPAPDGRARPDSPASHCQNAPRRGNLGAPPAGGVVQRQEPP